MFAFPRCWKLSNNMLTLLTASFFRRAASRWWWFHSPEDLVHLCVHSPGWMRTQDYYPVCTPFGDWRASRELRWKEPASRTSLVVRYLSYVCGLRTRSRIRLRMESIMTSQASSGEAKHKHRHRRTNRQTDRQAGRQADKAVGWFLRLPLAPESPAPGHSNMMRNILRIKTPE